MPVHPLEMVRWALSAVNKQPWQIVLKENAVHFYLKHTKGFVSEAAGDMRKIDMGIALCHFALAAEENGLNIQLCISDPGIAAEPDTEDMENLSEQRVIFLTVKQIGYDLLTLGL